MDRRKALQAMLEQKPDDAFVKYALALEYQKHGDAEQALATFERVLAEHEAYVPAYLMAGMACTKFGRPDRAREILEKGLKIAQAQGESQAHSEIADALAELGSEPGADEA